jgi:hypothetical protein
LNIGASGDGVHQVGKHKLDIRKSHRGKGNLVAGARICAGVENERGNTGARGCAASKLKTLGYTA